MRCPSCHRRLPAGVPCPGDGARTSPADEVADPATPVLPGLALEGVLGRGATARVFAARTAAGPVAVKLAHGPALAARFGREAAALERVGAPHVPALLSRGVTPSGIPYLVLERLEGESLATMMARLPGRGAAPLAEVARLVEAIALALDAAHGAGVVHRDVKPENLFLRPDGTAALLDLGLCRFASDAAAAPPGPALTHPDSRIGTPLYAAPELAERAQAAGPEADRYALGVIAFELLAGAPPFLGDAADIEQAHRGRRVPPLPMGGAGALDRVLARALAKRPEDRFASASELARAVAAAVCSPHEASPPGGVATASARTIAAPTALLAAETTPDTLARTAGARGGEVMRVHGSRVLAAFPAEPTAAEGVRAAIGAARALPDGTRVAIHVAPVRLRRGPTGTLAAGEALDPPLAWWPAEAAPFHLTPAARALAGPASGPTATGAERAPLRGRDQAIASISAAISRALTGRGPLLVTLIGEAGLGKSRLLEGLAHLAEVDVVAVAPGAGERSSPEAMTRALLAHALERAPAELDTATLERELGAATTPVALALGLAAPSKARAVPAATVRPQAAAAIASALRARSRRRPLVVLCDDAQRADGTALDAVERATLAGAGEARLAVVLAATPALLALRPDLGARAQATLRVELAPLERSDADALLRARLAPAEWIPDAALAELHRLACGSPAALHALADTLVIGGALRPSSTGVTFDPGPVWALGATEPGRALASRVVAALPEPLARAARTAAVLGDGLDVATFDALERALDPELTSGLDARVAIERLADAGVLAAGGDGFAFRPALLGPAIEAGAAPEVRRALHAAALRTSTGDTDHDARRRARHADACGERQAAAVAHLRLGRRAEARFADAEAEAHFSRALAALEPGDPGREAALAGRARVRTRAQRFGEAVEDLRLGRELAAARGDRATCARLLLDEATAHDWLLDFGAEEACVEAALAHLATAPEPALAARVDLARGRVAFRKDDLAGSIPLLESALASADACGEHETAMIATLLRAAALVFRGDLDAGEAAFDACLERARAAGDDLHLGVAHSNRQMLWLARRDAAAARADLGAAIEIARALGHAQLERAPTHNLAELLYQAGELDTALPLAERAAALARRFLAAPAPHDALLLCRLHVARGDVVRARAELEWLDRTVPPEAFSPSDALLGQLCRLALEVLANGCFEAAAFDALIASARERSLLEELPEVLAVAARLAEEAGDAGNATRWRALRCSLPGNEWLGQAPGGDPEGNR